MVSKIANPVNATQEGVQYLSSAGAWDGVDGSTSGYVLTSNGTGMAPSFQATSPGTYYSLSPYIVGPDAHSQYSTIGAAITAASGASPSYTNQANIYIKPQSGPYIENLTLIDGINLIGLSPSSISVNEQSPSQNPVIIQGTITLTEGGYNRIDNLSIQPTSGNSAFKYTGTSSNTFTNVYSSYISSDNVALIDRTTGGNGNCFFEATNSQLSTSSASGTLTNVNTGQTMQVELYYSTYGGIAAMSNNGSLGFYGYWSQIGALGIDSNNANATSSSFICSHSNLAQGSLQILQSASTCTDNVNLSYCACAVPNTAFTIGNTASTLTFRNCSGIPGNALLISGSPTVYKYQCNNADQNQQEVYKVYPYFNGSDFVTMQAAHQTTNATPYTLASVVVNQLEAVTLQGQITGSKDDQTNACGGNFLITARRASGGNITVVGTPIVNVNSTSTATFNVSVDTGSQSILLQVTGITATNYNWVTTYSYQKVLANT